jgi:hypothetical protein
MKINPKHFMLAIILSAVVLCGQINNPKVTSLTGTSASIGGSLLAAAGTCTSGTATVTGARAGMQAQATPSDGTNIAAQGTVITATVTANDTVTVNVCGLLAVTPTAKTYSVTVNNGL